ncbi:hypothetical protein BKA70DRAFT_1435492 [Coprinopsis sp. MPI-PUGE-AT-0042]|nr:hypothetical protein BKA70DRAFT_1435492 [Coprinopsis sp. MPI-PUGE-AT-0042]
MAKLAVIIPNGVKGIADSVKTISVHPYCLILAPPVDGTKGNLSVDWERVMVDIGREDRLYVWRVGVADASSPASGTTIKTTPALELAL